MPIDSRYELLGSPILFDTRTLTVQRQVQIDSRRGHRESSKPLGILSLGFTYC